MKEEAVLLTFDDEPAAEAGLDIGVPVFDDEVALPADDGPAIEQLMTSEDAFRFLDLENPLWRAWPHRPPGIPVRGRYWSGLYFSAHELRRWIERNTSHSRTELVH